MPLNARQAQVAKVWRTSIAALFAGLVIAGCGGGGGGGDSPADRPPSTPGTSHSWFVDADAGNDAAAGSQSSPWKTLARASTQILASGDSLLLKCGGTWRESLTLSAPNVPASGATLSAWGDCTSANRPIISGANLVSGGAWTVATGFGGKPVYVTNWSRPVTSLYLNGTRLTRARYPNYGGIGHEFKLIDSASSPTRFVIKPFDASVLAGVDLAGAKAYIRTSPWLVEAQDVAGSTGTGAITLAAGPTYAPQAEEGYFVEGKLALLDTAGEWFHDAVAGRLYVWTPDGSSPQDAALESVERDFGVTLSGISGTRVEQIAFERQAQAGLHIVDSPRTAVTAIRSLDAGAYGILIAGNGSDQSSGTSVQRSTIRNAGVNGISATSPGIEVVGNDIESTGVGASDTGVSAGVYMKSTGGSIRDNRILESGYAAILLSNAAGTTVSGNSLVRACRRFTDCGAVYSGGAPGTSQRASITSNAISDLVANVEGAVGGAAALVAGIYLDEGSANHDVLNNMVTRVGVGINLHNSANHLIQSNQVWLADQSSIRVHNSLATDRVRGNVIQDNALYASSHLIASAVSTTAPGSRLVYAQEWVHPSDAKLMFSGAEPNVVRRNSVASLTAASTVRWALVSGFTPQVLDEAQWAAYAVTESVKVLYPARPFLVTDGGANLIPNSKFQVAGAGWSLERATAGSAGTLTFGTCASDGCADFNPARPSDFLTSGPFRMSSLSGSNLYQLQVRAESPSGSVLTMAINRDGGDFGELGVVLTDQRIGAAQQVVGALFNATGEDQARLNFSGEAGKTVRFREVVVAQVKSYELLSPSRESALLTNETGAAKNVDCPSAVLRTCTVSDLSGQAISWPVTLAPNTAKVVLSADDRWKP